jgi:hypothetical protein
MTVRFLTGAAGLNFDFSMFSFQVPSVLSAAKAVMTVIARPANSLIRMFLIESSFQLGDYSASHDPGHGLLTVA